MGYDQDVGVLKDFRREVPPPVKVGVSADDHAGLDVVAAATVDADDPTAGIAAVGTALATLAATGDQHSRRKDREDHAVAAVQGDIIHNAAVARGVRFQTVYETRGVAAQDVRDRVQQRAVGRVVVGQPDRFNLTGEVAE